MLRILIADRSALVREALKGALEHEVNLQVVAEADDGTAAVAAAERARPDVAIIGIGVAAADCIATSCLIIERVPSCRTIVVADLNSERVMMEGLSCGASGYLTNDCSLADLVQAVQAVSRGETLIPPAMLGPLISELIGRRRDHDEALLRIARLSPRQRTVLNLLARGLKTKDIAAALVISPETARTHIQNILAKLSVHSRFEATSLVIGNGLLEALESADRDSAGIT